MSSSEKVHSDSSSNNKSSDGGKLPASLLHGAVLKPVERSQSEPLAPVIRVPREAIFFKRDDADRDEHLVHEQIEHDESSKEDDSDEPKSDNKKTSGKSKTNQTHDKTNHVPTAPATERRMPVFNWEQPAEAAAGADEEPISDHTAEFSDEKADVAHGYQEAASQSDQSELSGELRIIQDEPEQPFIPEQRSTPPQLAAEQFEESEETTPEPPAPPQPRAHVPPLPHFANAGNTLPPTGPVNPSQYNTPNIPPQGPDGAIGNGGNTPPPLPPIHDSAASPNFGPYSPDTPPAVYNTHGAPGNSAPQYNQMPAAPLSFEGRNSNVDPLARLGVVASWLRTGKERKNRIKDVGRVEKSTAANFDDVRTQQLRANRVQEDQARDIRQMRQNAGREQSPAPAIPFVEQSRTSPPQPPERPAPALNPEQQQLQSPEQPLELQPHQRIEHSTWHDIVVDQHGEAVNDAIQYGEGFKRERQQEAIRDRTGDNAVAGSNSVVNAAGTTVGGGLTPQAPGYYGPASTPQYSALPSGMTNPGLPQGVPTHVGPQHQLPANTPHSAVPGPVFWLMLAVILAAFFAAAFI